MNAIYINLKLPLSEKEAVCALFLVNLYKELQSLLG